MMNPSGAGLVFLCFIMVLWEVIGGCWELLRDRREHHRRTSVVVENAIAVSQTTQQQQRLHLMVGPRLPPLPIYSSTADGIPQRIPAPEQAAAVVVDLEKLSEIMKNCSECVICLQGFDCEEGYCGYQILPECGHKFHPGCIHQWLKLSVHNTCPVCRQCVS